AEHILALAAAAIVSAGLIYSAAAFDQTMKPSRGVLLLSFIMFTPISLGYRRFVHRFVAASTANKTFLVIGSGESAARFYESYKASPNQQRLHFVDLVGDHVGKTIAGAGTPIIEGDLEAKLSDPQTP